MLHRGLSIAQQGLARLHGVPVLGLLDTAVGRIKAHRRRDEFDAFATAGLVFIHVPRCAGTSISHTIYNRFINHYSLAEHERVFDADLRSLPVFTVVRNPWDRLVSCWSMAQAGHGHEGDVTVNSRDRRPVEEFKSFDHFVLDGLAKLNPAETATLFAPQTNYLRAPLGKLSISHCGRFEDLKSTEQWLSDRLGKTISLPQRNGSERSDYRKYYTSAMIEAVRAFYHADVELLGYDFE